MKFDLNVSTSILVAFTLLKFEDFSVEEVLENSSCILIGGADVGAYRGPIGAAIGRPRVSNLFGHYLTLFQIYVTHLIPFHTNFKHVYTT